MEISEFTENLIELINENNKEIRKTGSKCNIHVFYKIVEYLDVWIKQIVNDEQYIINIQKFNNILQQITDSFVNEDFILMSDLFEFELVEEMKKIID